MLNTSPGHLRNMKQTVCSAKVYKCTEIGNVLNGSFYNVSLVDALEQLFLHLSFLSYEKLSSVTDNSSSLRVELCDYEFNLLICIFCKILLIGVGYKACRDKDSGLIHNNA